MNPRLRDILLFVGGGTVVYYELVLTSSYHPEALGLGVTMMLGAPIVYRLLERWDKR